MKPQDPPLALPTMEQVLAGPGEDPRSVVERQLAEVRWAQRQVEAVADRPQLLLCAHCQENPTARETVAIGTVLRYQAQLARILSWLVPSWLALQKGGKRVAEQLGMADRVEMFLGWCSKLPDSALLRVQQAVTVMYNERRAGHGTTGESQGDAKEAPARRGPG